MAVSLNVVKIVLKLYTFSQFKKCADPLKHFLHFYDALTCRQMTNFQMTIGRQISGYTAATTVLGLVRFQGGFNYLWV